MKIFIKLMILALVLSYASMFVIKKPDGTPIKTLDSLKPDMDMTAVIGITDKLQQLLPTGSNESNAGNTGMDIEITPQQLYRWQDEQGAWHYTNTPPPGVAAEAMELDAPTVMMLYRQDAEQVSDGDAQGSNVTDTSSDILPSGIGEMQQARDVSTQLQEKMDQQQRILDEL